MGRMNRLDCMACQASFEPGKVGPDQQVEMPGAQKFPPNHPLKPGRVGFITGAFQTIFLEL